MKLTNFGGATAILEHKGKRMLFDPWLDDGIFHGSWFHYPPLNIGIPELGKLDYVYISHIHEDHCSVGTIRHINPDAEIILMDRNPNFVLKFLHENQFTFKKIHLIAPRTPQEIAPGLRVDMVEADPADQMGYIIDSSMILTWDNFVIYNANDCQPYDGGLQYIEKTYPNIDIALLPYSGGSGYPSCYTNLSDAEKTAEKRRILASRIRAFGDVVERLKPARVMPFADQYVIGGNRAHLNKYVSHPPAPWVVEPELETRKLVDRLTLLNSGQSITLETGQITPPDPYRRFDDTDREAYLADIAYTQYDHDKISFAHSVPLDRLVEYARAQLWEKQQRRKSTPAFTLVLEVPELAWRYKIPLAHNGCESLDIHAEIPRPYLKISANFTLMVMLLMGHTSWNIADAALFLDYERVPNVYDPEIYVLLNFLRL